MTKQNALRLADQAIANILNRDANQAVWVVGDTVRCTPDTDLDVNFMHANGAALAGVFSPGIGRLHLLDAILAAA